MGHNRPTRCLALCIEAELNRLVALIAAIGGNAGAAARQAAINGGVLPAGGLPQEATLARNANTAVGAAAIPVFISAFPPGSLIMGGAGGVAEYNAAIAALPAANQALVDNYIHYRMIRRNLNYHIANDNFGGIIPTLVIADIPYAASAMQDTRERIRLLAPGSRLYSTNAPQVTIGIPPVGFVQQFTIAQVHEHIYHTLYQSWLTFVNNNPSAYTNAATELINQLGPYCAYCEANLKAQIDVEHMLPKGRNQGQGFPSLAKSWLNFLPACPRCNSTKNARPSKNDIHNAVDDDAMAARNAAGGPAGALAEAAVRNFTKDDLTSRNIGAGWGLGITDREYARLYQRHYQFPLEATSYRNIGFALCNIVGGNDNIDNIPILNQLNWTIQVIDEQNKYVTVNVPGGVSRNYRVYVDDGTYGAAVIATPALNVRRVSRMVDICGLNSINANTDRRVLERTEAWFMALEAVSRIQNDLAGLAGLALGGAAPNVYNSVYALWRDNVINTIKEKGFISVWLKIFAAFQHPLTGTPGAVPTFPAILTGNEVGGAVAGGQMNLAQDIATVIKNSRYFPNTNFTMVP